MTRHAALLRDLADRLRRKQLRSLVYFHTDHFEPWREIGDRVPAVGQGIVDSIGDFREACDRIDFARRLTLFYKPHLNYALRRGTDLARAHPDDLVGFLPRSRDEEDFGRAAMQELVARSRHEIQVHIHHEYYTATKGHTDQAAIDWFASPLGRTLDDGRLELAIRLNREIIARETGAMPERWFFVHGHWALNASDDSSCAITNEIAILLRNGCCGDFTFPAGRLHVNPRIKVPYFCRPVDAPKGYDSPQAEPEIAYGNRAAAAQKFFLWSAAASGHHCSIDYMSESVRAHLENTEKAAVALIEGSYAAGGELFVKTHAHSMHPSYFAQARAVVFPHQYPAVQALLSTVFDAAQLAGLAVRFQTASEVYDRLVGAADRPQIDLAATYLKDAAPSQTPRPRPVASAAGRNGALTATKPAFRAAAIAELVRETAGEVLGERIARLGQDGSGADEHYARMLRRGVKIPEFDLAVLEMIRRCVPRVSHYHEIGSGIGILPFLLALNGFPAVGIECDRRRHATAVAIWRELSARSGVPRQDCRLIARRFPQAVAGEDLRDSIAILTDFVGIQSADRRQKIIAGLRRYRFAIVDLQRFCVVREAREAQLELLDELRGHGFQAVHEAIDPDGHEFALALFENEPSVRPGPLSYAWSRFERLWRPHGSA